MAENTCPFYVNAVHSQRWTVAKRKEAYIGNMSLMWPVCVDFLCTEDITFCILLTAVFNFSILAGNILLKVVAVRPEYLNIQLAHFCCFCQTPSFSPS